MRLLLHGYLMKTNMNIKENAEINSKQVVGVVPNRWRKPHTSKFKGADCCFEETLLRALYLPKGKELSFKNLLALRNGNEDLNWASRFLMMVYPLQFCWWISI